MSFPTKEARRKRMAPDFGGYVAGTRNSWDDFGRNAEYERVSMMAEFNLWAEKKHRELSGCLQRSKHFQRGQVSFTRAALSAAPSPAEVPLVVIEFADLSLDILETEHKLSLLDVFYKRDGGFDNEFLVFDPSNEAEVMALWDWFMEDRAEGEGSDAKAC